MSRMNEQKETDRPVAAAAAFRRVALVNVRIESRQRSPVGLLMLALPELSLTAQLATWTAASLAMVVLWFRVFKPGFQKTRIGTSAGEAIGEIGLLVAAVAPFERGKVRFQRPVLGSEEWVCVADSPIAAGERVKVITVEGSFLTVGKI